MPRGPSLRAEEVDKVKVLKAEGKTQKEMAQILNRSVPTIGKLLVLARLADGQREIK